VTPKYRASAIASGSEGVYLSFSIELIVCRDTPIASASWP